MEIIETSCSRIGEYAIIPISFEADRILRVRLKDNGMGGILLLEHPCKAFAKNYDLLNPPVSWQTQFNTGNWTLILAAEGDKLIGGATVAWNTNDINLLEGRRDQSVLWDLRVIPDKRREGIGRRLFGAAAEWSRSQGCVRMKIETQNTNVAACHFYASMGATLGDICRYAYQDNPLVANEIQLNWYFNLI